MEGIVELDLHGKNKYQAKVALDAALRRNRGVYRIRVIHGYNSGTELRDMIRDEYKGHSKVLRLVTVDPGTTDIVLREF